MNKWLKRILIIFALFSVILCSINVYFAVKYDNLFGNLFTAISGWVSFLATIGVGIFAYLQNKFYQEEAEKCEKYVDLVVENVQVVNYLLPNNKLGRSSLSKKNNGNQRFLLSVFSYDKPIFDCKVTKCLKDGEILLVYDMIQPIYHDEQGKTTLLKNEMMKLTAEIPHGDNLTGRYDLQLEYKNQHGDIYVKKVFINMDANVLGNVEKFWQGKSELDKEQKKVNNSQESKRRK